MKTIKRIFGLLSVILCDGILASCTTVLTSNRDSHESNGDSFVSVETAKYVDAGCYFSNMVACEYLTRNNSLLDFDGNQINFDNLVYREVELLSQDILYRLYSLYGAGCATSDPNGSTYNLIHNDTEFSYNGNNAQINNDVLIQTPYRYTTSGKPVYLYSSNADYYENSANKLTPQINELGTYAYNYLTSKWNVDTLQGGVFNNSYSILGGYEYSIEDGFGTTFTRKNYAWNWSDNLDITPTTSAQDGFAAFYSNNKTILETNIANILAGTGNEELSEAISDVNELGITSANLTTIVSYIKSAIIGDSLIDLDNSLLTRLYSLLGGYELNSANSKLLIGSNSDLHYYKAYSLLIPAVVNQAVRLTFADTAQSIYLSGAREVKKLAECPINSLTDMNFTAVTLTAKNDDIKLTKMVVSISNIDVNDLTLSYTIAEATGYMIADGIAVELTTGSNIVLDFSSHNSKLLSISGTISLLFQNKTNNNFGLSIDGYYSF